MGAPVLSGPSLSGPLMEAPTDPVYVKQLPPRVRAP